MLWWYLCGVSWWKLECGLKLRKNFVVIIGFEPICLFQSKFCNNEPISKLKIPKCWFLYTFTYKTQANSMSWIWTLIAFNVPKNFFFCLLISRFSKGFWMISEKKRTKWTVQRPAKSKFAILLESSNPAKKLSQKVKHIKVNKSPYLKIFPNKT